MATLFYCFLLLIFITLSISSDSPSKSDKCFKVDSCLFKTASKTCSCESDCHVYGTCCQDIKKHQKDISHSSYQCYNRRTSTPVFVKRSCLDDFRGHISYKLTCHDDDEDKMDVKNNLLVTSRVTKITYWNKQCAKCNDEIASDLDFWYAVVQCPSHKDVNERLIRRNLTFDQDKLRWGLEIGETFLPCDVKYSPPSNIEEVKHCTPNVIDSCPVDFKDKEVSAKCSQYYAERKMKNSHIYYKNVHCAVCNGANLEDLECPGFSTPEDNIEESDFHEMVEVIFTNGEWLYKEPGNLFKCSKGYTYDAFRERCRTEEIKEEVIMIVNSSNVSRNVPLILMWCLFLVIFL